MHFFYDLHFHMLHTLVRPSYAAVKAREPVLPHGRPMLKLLAPAALLMKRPLKLRRLLRKVFAL
jgi:hypothetical protein